MTTNNADKKDSKPPKTPPPSNGKPVSQMRPLTERTSFVREIKKEPGQVQIIKREQKPSPTPKPSKGKIVTEQKEYRPKTTPMPSKGILKKGERKSKK